jgi:hypothetical protein
MWKTYYIYQVRWGLAEQITVEIGEGKSIKGESKEQEL